MLKYIFLVIKIALLKEFTGMDMSSFEHISSFIGLDAITISGYAKGVSYNIKTKISGTNHEWNIIKLDNVYYQIDSTWEAGYLSGRYFQKIYKEFYFCPDPDEFFPSNWPKEPRWQFIYPPLSMEEFGKRAFVYPLFLEYCRLDIKYYQVEVKCKDRIRIYNKKPDVILAPEIKDIDDGYTDDCIFNIEYNNDYNDIILKFKHKGLINY